MKTKKKSMYFVLSLALIAILTAIDQFTKHLAVVHLKDQPDIDLIPGVLKLQYLENRGAAFGLLQNQQWLFLILTVLFLLVGCYVIYQMPKNGHFYAGYLILTILCAGALGNFIDRLMQQYVVDFVYFSWIDFPIFNVADIYCTVSVCVIFILILFIYKEEDMELILDSIRPRKKETQE